MAFFNFGCLEMLGCAGLAQLTMLPANVTPHNTDDEVAAFYCVSIGECTARLADVSWDAGLVTAWLLARISDLLFLLDFV
ncbi:hypothetical protein [Chitinibacter sp. GC72]|uniref:hypothetical protein n=1 Tax=Chitinibacter sp. GC72 TaxID=1526917 RepID=UPI0012F774B9|nr:hypothetical protein [Chitinibacter sp. GC72]